MLMGYDRIWVSKEISSNIIEGGDSNGQFRFGGFAAVHRLNRKSRVV